MDAPDEAAACALQIAVRGSSRQSAVVVALQGNQRNLAGDSARNTLRLVELQMTTGRRTAAT